MSKYQPSLAKQQFAVALQALHCAFRNLDSAAESVEESYPVAAGTMRARAAEAARLRADIRADIEASALPQEARP